jgi:hypothetical protein
MLKLWGPVTEIRDLGVVAEQCPYCEQIMPCLLRSVYRWHFVLFVKTAAPIGESSCLCTICHKAFPCEPWRYTNPTPIQEAKTSQVEDLLARTNPGLAERLQLKEHIGNLGGDARFTAAFEQLEKMRPGNLRSVLLQQLLGWDRLTEEKRANLAQHIGSRARSSQFARQIAPGFPAPGCLIPALVAVVTWSTIFFVPPLQSWLWGGIVVTAGFAAAALIRNAPLTRNARQWTRQVLIPEAHDANVSLGCFLAVIDDVPVDQQGALDDLWPIKDQIETIRKVLIAEGKL